MKVLHVTHSYAPEGVGGIERYLRMTIAAQRARGTRVVVLTGSMQERDTCGVEEYELDGVRVLRVHRDDWYNDHYAHSYHPEASRRIRSIIEHERPDVVHVHQWIRLTSDVVAQARGAGIPTVVTLHDVYTSCPRAFRIDRDQKICSRELSVGNCVACVPRFGHETEREIALGIELFRDQYRSELEMAHRVLVAERVTAELLSRTTGLPEERFQVHALPYERRFEGMVRRPSRGPFRFGYWGGLTSHKGPHVLLQAFRVVVANAGEPVELHVFGPLDDGAVRGRLESLAEDLPVTFHGAFEAADLVDASLDAAVFPAVCFEGFGFGLTEAFDLGLPSIVSDIGALASRIGDAGRKVPVGDVAALAEAMTTFSTDAALRSTFAGNIPDLPCTPAEHAVELHVLYGEAIGEATAAPRPVDPERRAQLLASQRESYARALRSLGHGTQPH